MKTKWHHYDLAIEVACFEHMFSGENINSDFQLDILKIQTINYKTNGFNSKCSWKNVILLFALSKKSKYPSPVS